MEDKQKFEKLSGEYEAVQQCKWQFESSPKAAQRPRRSTP